MTEEAGSRPPIVADPWTRPAILWWTALWPPRCWPPNSCARRCPSMKPASGGRLGDVSKRRLDRLCRAAPKRRAIRPQASLLFWLMTAGWRLRVNDCVAVPRRPPVRLASLGLVVRLAGLIWPAGRLGPMPGKRRRCPRPHRRFLVVVRDADHVRHDARGLCLDRHRRAGQGQETAGAGTGYWSLSRSASALAKGPVISFTFSRRLARAAMGAEIDRRESETAERLEGLVSGPPPRDLGGAVIAPPGRRRREYWAARSIETPFFLGSPLVA